ncbi:MAG TPA: MoaD/ThiS family protein [Candidatus Paceibacterota bacterium]|nr:MoaD/ThiS family protein [Verrucomicrobiota bacterium]HRY48792.1 MoaD/ThiS family protein [Candidatus Paceibacterota bacterium]HRZ99478.1 MoaD/ThiS family protein [Candidatus Paceibacterota bacterium]
MKILFFAQLREVSGFSELELRLSDPVSARELWERLQQMLPRLREIKVPLQVACNQELVGWETRLNPQDEVAFLPPVSGG